MVKIRCGWLADGAAWSSRPLSAGGAGVRDHDVVLGPRGLVDVLATRVGLKHPPVQHSVRVAQYRAIMQRHPHAWFQDSFARDPWNTAAAVLALRDEAVMAGWDMAGGAPDAREFPRLNALWTLEHALTVGLTGAAGETLAPGPADDLQELRRALEARGAEEKPWPLGISAITCLEDPATLPGQWPRILELLRNEIDAVGGSFTVEAHEEPARVPSFRLVRAPQEWTAAETTARIIADALENGEPLTVLATSDTIALDAQLTRRGLPPVAYVPGSAGSLATQVLPVFLDALTPHLDVHALAALLTLELPGTNGRSIRLLPTAASRHLVDALSREPGISNAEGSAWAEALAHIEREDHDAAAENVKHVPALPVIQDFCALLSPPEHTYFAAMPDGNGTRVRIDALHERLAFLEERLTAIARVAHETVSTVRTHASNLRALLALTGSDNIAERELTDLLTASAPSRPSLLGHRTPTPWTLATEPAHVDNSAGHTVIWWGAIDTHTAPPSTWDSSEFEYLRAAGAHPWTREKIASLETRSRLRSLTPTQRMIAIAPERVHGEMAREHPLLSRLAVGAWQALTPGAPIPKLSTIFDDPAFATHAHALLRYAIARGDLEVMTEHVPAAPTHLARRVEPGDHLLPDTLSYTALHMLITDTLGWVLKYQFGIEPGGLARVPTGDRMVGSLLHALIDALVDAHTGKDGHVSRQGILDEIAKGGVKERLRALVPQHASELALPGNEALFHEVEETALASVERLFRVLLDEGVAVREIEHSINGTDLPLTIDTPRGPQNRSIDFRGSIDFVGEDADGRAVVLDFKWTRGERSYRERVGSGTALQLATYAWALSARKESTGEVRTGYFLLRQGEFVSTDPAFGGKPGSATDTPSDTQIFAMAAAAARRALSEVAHGVVRSETAQNAVLGRNPYVSTTLTEVIKARARIAERSGCYFENANARYSDYTLLTGVEGDFS